VVRSRPLSPNNIVEQGSSSNKARPLRARCLALKSFATAGRHALRALNWRQSHSAKAPILVRAATLPRRFLPPWKATFGSHALEWRWAAL